MTRDKETADVREVQTMALRRQGGQPVVCPAKAIHEAGFETGGSFRFVPESVEDTGMLVAIGQTEEIDGRTRRGGITKTIRREGTGGQTMSVQVPDAALEALGIDPQTIDWDDPPVFDVWAGEGLIALDLPEERTVTFVDDRGDEDEV